MVEYNVTISSKGQFVLPKEIRDQFKLSNGSKIKVIVDGDTIMLKPRSIADELQELILADIAKDGKQITPETVKKYQMQLNKALSHMVAEAEQEYSNKEYVPLVDLKRENDHV